MPVAPSDGLAATVCQASGACVSDAMLILASASPRRRELLQGVVSRFAVRACPRAEPLDKPDTVGPRAWAEALAYFKARAVAEENPGRWTLGADTVVAGAGWLLGKPRDAADARRMLSLQAGRASDVITGVCLVRVGSAVQRLFHSVVTRVWMRSDPAALESYLQSGDWQGKAGAYGIQDVGDRLVERLEGSFSNVVGLPVEAVARLLRCVPELVGLLQA
jgi:septum formation protein